MADINHLFPNAEQFDTMNALLALIAANRGRHGGIVLEINSPNCKNGACSERVSRWI